MPEIQLGAHTIRTHGAKVARTHMHDWLVLLLLVVIEVVLNVIEPFHHFVGAEMMADLKYPLQDNTVPLWSVPIIAILLPLAVILIYYFVRKDFYDLHQAVLGKYYLQNTFSCLLNFLTYISHHVLSGLLFSVLITGVLTDAIKDAVGRPRPDFFWRCFPDGKAVFDPVTSRVMCTGLKSVIKEGHKSFPSGHTSWSFAGLGFLSWYMAGKIRVFDQRGHVAKLCIVVFPLLIAALIGVSRVDDYWHHWQDVFAGGLLGMTVASFCYLQFFPPPYDIDGWGPHIYFQMLAESRNETRPDNLNGLNVAPSEIENVCIYSRNDDNMNSIMGEMESGRRRC
ncbi:lipid phosphate phosphatase 2-like isoform X1 [Bidens hawaiensis]|uniref:lipid phosphate phosphatase 2-like isoform X1 n=1 Tax=Bidens hawaiensis TaxID=980011 RepID=UPI0040492652